MATTKKKHSIFSGINYFWRKRINHLKENKQSYRFACEQFAWIVGTILMARTKIRKEI
jgi:hypothetical protein